MSDETAQPRYARAVLRPPDAGQRRYFGEHVEALRRYIEGENPFAFRRVSGELTFFVDDEQYLAFLTAVSRER